MADGNSYPAVALDQDGKVVDSQTVIQFTDGNDQPGSGGGSQLSVAAVTVTSAQLLQLHTTPVVIVPAPGAGKVVIPISPTFAYVFGGTPYTDGGGNLWLSTVTAKGNGQTWAQFAGAGFWDQADSVLFQLNADMFGVPSDFVDQAVVLADDTADPTLGNGSVIVTVPFIVAQVA